MPKKYSTRITNAKIIIEEKDLELSKFCRFCGNSVKTLEIFQKTPLIHHVRCDVCHAVSYDRILTQKKLDEWYANYNYVGYDPKAKHNDKISFYNKKRFVRHFIKIINKTLTIQNEEELAILDFGGGDGSLAYAIAKELMEIKTIKNISITVADYNKTLCEVNDERINICHVDNIYQVNGQQFNIVIASAILEHLPNLREDFAKLKSLMKKESILYIRTPYKYPLFNVCRKLGITIDILFPVHIWDLGKKFFEYIENDSLKLLISRPSIVQTSFRANFIVTLFAYILKSPFYLFHNWPFVGGWEVVYKYNN